MQRTDKGVTSGEKRENTAQWIISALAILAWSAAIGIVSLGFAAMPYGREMFASYFKSGGLLILNLLPVLLLALLFFFICNRMWMSVLFSGAAVIVPTLINYFKLFFRNDPLLAADAVLVMEAAKIGGNYNIDLSGKPMLAFAAITVCAIASALLLKTRFQRVKPRIVGLLAVLLIGAALYVTVYADEDVYDTTENLDVVFATGYRLSPWNETDQYVSRGFVYPLIYSATDLGADKPKGYGKNRAIGLLDGYGYDNIPEDKKVSVISIMLESYSDFSELGILNFGEDPYRFFHELQKESVSGELVTNIFAGGTIDTERAYITGATRLREYRYNAASFARYFNEQGYFTEFCHPGYSWFYNRENVMRYLGFQSLHFYEDRYDEGIDAIIRDDKFFSDIKTLYEEATADGAPYFNFSVTYQNHGPYAPDYLYDENAAFVKNAGFSEESYNILNNYFWGINKTDEAMKDLVEYFRGLDEPVVLVLFGDHKPGLGDGNFVYTELGVDLSRGTEESFYDYYSTPYVIWANDSAKEALGNDVKGDGGSMSPCFLMSKVFELCSWGGDEYLKACASMRGVLDVVNEDGVVRENGVLTSEPSETAAERLSDFFCMDYYRAVDEFR